MARLSILKNKKLVTASGLIVLSSGLTWIGYQIYRTYDALNHFVKSEALKLENKRAEYIYILDDKFKEKVCSLINDGGGEEKPSTRYVFDLPLKWWKSWKHSYAWRLLSMAKEGDHSDRLRAVHSLSMLKSLKASDLRQLAQVCDKRTAVGLARSEGVDLQFFLKPPYVHVTPTKKQLTERFHNLLILLHEENHHSCVAYFLKKAFPLFHKRYLNLLDDTSLEVPKQAIRDVDILPMCVENLLHHSTIHENARDIVTLGGLPLLMDLSRYFHEDKRILIMLGKIMSNLSIYQGLLHDIFVSGWVGVLAQWAQSPDVEMSAPATRALANIDADDPLKGTYARRIYLLHPSFRSFESTKMDVVFTHGLLGGVFISWRQRDRECVADNVVFDDSRQVTSDVGTMEYFENLSDVKTKEWEDLMSEYEMVMADCPEHTEGPAKGPYTYTGSRAHKVFTQVHKDKEGYTICWPKDWLASDCRHLRIIGINYDTQLSAWGSMCPFEQHKRTLDDRSDELLAKLKLAGLGKRPIIWVSHSMGGLLVKNMLVKAWESGDEASKNFCRNTKAIVFYSTPHFGSPLANLSQTTSLLMWPSVEVKELKKRSPALIQLHKSFLKMLEDNPIEVISFAETKPTAITSLRVMVNFVPFESANPGVGEFFAIPQDHLCICKPASRQSFLYQKVLHIIQECLASTKD